MPVTVQDLVRNHVFLVLTLLVAVLIVHRAILALLHFLSQIRNNPPAVSAIGVELVLIVSSVTLRLQIRVIVQDIPVTVVAVVA